MTILRHLRILRQPTCYRLLCNAVTDDLGTVQRYDKRTTELKSMNLHDTKETYRSKSNYELLRSLLILKTCTYQVFVHNAEQMMTFSRKILGRRLFTYVMKKSFYGQFAGGENIGELKKCVENLANYGVHSMLNYTVEADLGSAVGEESCQNNLETILSILESSKEVCDARPFSSFKITGLTTPQLLYQFTEILQSIKSVFLENSEVAKNSDEFVNTLSRDIKNNTTLLINRVIYREAFVNITNSPGLFDEADSENLGYLDFYQFRETLLANQEVINRVDGIPNLTRDMIEGCDRLRDRLEQIAEKTKSLDARIMVDAEQTYMQPAIDYLTLELMQEHNKEVAYIYNTYQCYLKRTPNNVTLDASDAARRGYNLGVKLVRGAYMAEERARAARLGYRSPIQDTKEETDAAYHDMLDVLLHLVSRGSCHVLAGSHNEATVKYLVRRLHELKIDPNNERVCFGQLYGLSDPTTFRLRSGGYRVLKAIAWGPVEAVLPFLARRAQENTGVVGSSTSTRELDLLKIELRRRMVEGR